MSFSLTLAKAENLLQLIPLVTAYHNFEGIKSSPEELEKALLPLLRKDGPGKIWMITVEEQIIGYIAICFGYTIEFGGKDAFLDEFYIIKPWRNKGIGRKVLQVVLKKLPAMHITALHLEVDRDNEHARRLYAAEGFKAREKYMLMTCKTDS